MVWLKLPIGLLHFVVGGCGVGGCVQKCKKEEPPEKKITLFKRRVCLPFFCTPKKMTLTVEEELQNKDPPTSSFITIMKLFFQKFFSAHVA
jgi:hypothetical protein